jgi:hypothetical protein
MNILFSDNRRDDAPRSRLAARVSWIAQILAAIILAQTLYFKFTAAPESVKLFTTLGLEPVGRLGSGVAELIAVVLLLWPRRAFWGAWLALGIMGGALHAHLTRLGLIVDDDGGLLFGLAVTVSVCALIVLALRWPRRC